VDSGNPDAKRLYDDLLSNYNKLVRPVSNVSEAVTVHLKLKLSQLIAVVSGPAPPSAGKAICW
jgi:nicotinic acetylcholine receptor